MEIFEILQCFKFFATAPNPKIISLSENKYGPGLEGLWKQGRSSTGLFLQHDLGVFNWPKYDLKFWISNVLELSWYHKSIQLILTPLFLFWNDCNMHWYLSQCSVVNAVSQCSVAFQSRSSCGMGVHDRYKSRFCSESGFVDVQIFVWYQSKLSVIRWQTKILVYRYGNFSVFWIDRKCTKISISKDKSFELKFRSSPPFLRM